MNRRFGNNLYDDLAKPGASMIDPVKGNILLNITRDWRGWTVYSIYVYSRLCISIILRIPIHFTVEPQRLIIDILLVIVYVRHLGNRMNLKHTQAEGAIFSPLKAWEYLRTLSAPLLHMRRTKGRD